MSTTRHPMQPVILDDEGIARFKANKIIRFLVDWARPRGMSLNELAEMPFDQEDWEQLAQLIGYSVCGFGDLSYASEDVVQAADDAVEKLLHKQPAP